METTRETVRDVLNRAEAHLLAHGVPNARRNAEWLLCDTLGWVMLDLYVRSPTALEAGQVREYWSRVERRAAREPLQYILGTTEFMSLPFLVRPGVFVPRPDTEVLVERVETWLRARPLHEPLTVLDLCCGSGIVGVSLARRIANLMVTAVDASLAAMQLTTANAARNEVAGRVHAEGADAFEFLEHTSARFGAVVCNPPYIESAELSGLPQEVRDHEPVAALDGGADGLDFYRRAIPLLPARLVAGGFVAFEIGDTQGHAVSMLMHAAGFDSIEVTQDYAGRDRVVSGVAPE